VGDDEPRLSSFPGLKIHTWATQRWYKLKQSKTWLHSLSLLEVRAGRNHLLMQNAHDVYRTRFREVENDVLAVFESLQAWMNQIAPPTDRRVIRQKLKTSL
jgi:hypothetical protein